MRTTRWMSGLLLVLVILLAACVAPQAPAAESTAPAGEAAAAAPATEPVELRIMWWGVQQRHDRTLQVIELFEKKYPNITISPEYMGQDTYGEKVSTQIAAGNAPDIIQMGNDYVDYARRGALLDLAPYVGDPIDLSGFSDGFIAPARYEGTLYGVPLATNGISMIANLDLIERAGMQLPPAEWTWDDVDAWGKQFVETMGPEYVAIADRSNTPAYFDFFLRQSGRSLVKDGQVAFTEQDVIDWFGMWQRWREAGVAPSAEVASAWSELDVNSSLVPAGKAAMTLNWVNQLPNFDNAMEDDVDLFPLPTGGEGKENGFWLHPAQFWVIPSTSEHPYEAALFADFTINDPEATQILGVDRGFPGSPAVRDSITEVAEPAVQKMLIYFNNYIANAGPKSQEMPNGSEFAAAFTRASQEVAFGQKSLEEVAADVVAAAQAAVTK